MATKVSLLKSFSDGQGAGIGTYTTYTADHDSNYTSIETTINAIIDELVAANIPFASFFADILAPSAAGGDGRLSVGEARITYTTGGTTITVTSGRIYAAGRRIVVVGATLTGFSSAGTRYISVDQAGLLSVQTVASQGVFDIATIVQAGSTLGASDVTDNLDFSTQGFLYSADTIHKIPNRRTFADVVTGFTQPVIRLQSVAGVLEDMGFVHLGTANWMGIVARRATAAGSGAGVVMAEFTPQGQFNLQEQAQVQLIRSTTQSITNGASFVTVTFDTPAANGADPRNERREPQTYITNPFITSGGTVTVPAGAEFAGSYLVGYYLNFETTAGAVVFVHARIRITNGSANTIATNSTPIVPAVAAVNTIVSSTGLVDLEPGDTVELQVRHGDTVARNILDARFFMIKVAGPVVGLGG